MIEKITLGYQALARILANMPRTTKGDWSAFIDDSGDKWSGWPLSVHADSEDDKVVVRSGGFYPYEWDASMSQEEAVANSLHIAMTGPNPIEQISDGYIALYEKSAILEQELEKARETEQRLRTSLVITRDQIQKLKDGAPATQDEKDAVQLLVRLTRAVERGHSDTGIKAKASSATGWLNRYYARKPRRILRIADLPQILWDMKKP